jgi:hypothetical protein
MPGGRLIRVGLIALMPTTLLTLIAYPWAETPSLPQAMAAQPADPGRFELKKGDHICIIGNTLAERMQHDGWLETYLHARHPNHDLTIRNLGYSGDEVDTRFRLRSQDFGTPDQWLSGNAPIPRPQDIADRSVVHQNRFENTNTKADVIFAFFGYNESFAGEEGLPKFKDDLEKWIKHTLSQKYNGKSAPRLVLFSPIAFEDHKSPNLPTGAAVEQINKNLWLYTQAMEEVVKANKVRFVNLYHLSIQLYAQVKKPLTINGVHLTAQGNHMVSEWIDLDLFGTPPKYDHDKLENIRSTVQDKNFHWFQRYRVTDGYSTYGGRAWLKFVGGQTNYEVVQRELDILDIMTRNRDKVIWQVAKGKEANRTTRTYRVRARYHEQAGPA